MYYETKTTSAKQPGVLLHFQRRKEKGGKHKKGKNENNHLTLQCKKVTSVRHFYKCLTFYYEGFTSVLIVFNTASLF